MKPFKIKVRSQVGSRMQQVVFTECDYAGLDSCMRVAELRGARDSSEIPRLESRQHLHHGTP